MRTFKAVPLFVAFFCLWFQVPAGAQQLAPQASLPPSTLTTYDAAYWSTHVDLADQDISKLTQADINSLASGPAACRVATADGATKILLKCVTPQPGTVTFAASGRIQGDDLRRVNKLLPPVNVPTRVVNKLNIAFALYTVPESLNKGEMSHVITFGAVFTPMCQCGQPIAVARITLIRPPVILIHGLWSNAGTWINSTGAQPALSRAGFNTYLCDYKATNNQSLITNQFVPMSNSAGIKTAFSVYRGRGIAITRVDIVAHSLGGLVTRKFASWNNYRSIYNYYAGYVRRFITIGTPHFGSTIATILTSAISSPRYGSLVAFALNKLDMPYGPAIIDLIPSSAALRKLGATPISAYAEIGVYLGGSAGSLNAFISSLSFYGYTYNDIFNGLPSDLIVAAISQEGGLPVAFTTTTRGTNHLEETASAPIGADVVRLLSGPLKSMYVPGFPPPALLAPLPTSLIVGASDDPFVAVPQITPSSFATVTSPTPGQVFQPGDDMDVSVSPTSGVNLQQVLIIASMNGVPIGSALLTSPPYTADIPIPIDEVGNVDISTFAEDTSGDMCEVEDNAVVQTTATIQSLTVSSENELPTPITLTSQGSTVQLDTLGLFSDGVQRDITLGSQGTTYVSDNTNAVSVSPDGLATAVGNGDAEITVSNGIVSSQVEVDADLAVPQILSLDPNAVVAGGEEQLNLVGTDLGGATQLQFLLNGSPDANITASSLQNLDTEGGTLSADVTVDPNAALGPRTVVITTLGGQSDPLAAPDAVTFTVVAAPTISSLSPNPILAGGPDFTLTVSGAGYLSGATVLWNGAPLTTTLVSPSQLTADVPATLIANPGTAQVVVSMDGGMSNTLNLPIELTNLSLSNANLTRNTATHTISVTITLSNVGFNTAPSVQVTNATLSSKSTTATLPLTVGDITAGATGSGALTFPGSAGSSGSSATLTVSGTFTGGSFKASLPVTLP